jgi:hypothetical protein
LNQTFLIIFAILIGDHHLVDILVIVVLATFYLYFSKLFLFIGLELKLIVSILKLQMHPFNSVRCAVLDHHQSPRIHIGHLVQVISQTVYEFLVIYEEITNSLLSIVEVLIPSKIWSQVIGLKGLLVVIRILHKLSAYYRGNLLIKQQLNLIIDSLLVSEMKLLSEKVIDEFFYFLGRELITLQSGVEHV